MFRRIAIAMEDSTCWKFPSCVVRNAVRPAISLQFSVRKVQLFGNHQRSTSRKIKLDSVIFLARDELERCREAELSVD